MADALARAASDLALLLRADRDIILGALSAAERRRVQAAMRAVPPPDAAPHSPWFHALRASDAVTPAARAALAPSGPVEKSSPPAHRPGRSLLQAAGELLTAGMRR